MGSGSPTIMGAGGCTYENVSIQIIEQVELGNDDMLASMSSTGKTNPVALLRMGAHTLLQKS